MEFIFDIKCSPILYSYDLNEGIKKIKKPFKILKILNWQIPDLRPDIV